ncbi:MAG TPA: hypothetical protein VHE33_06975 [Acidobacteriaceae bacterium]|nr:hypothetical protein [Acidobacteriaceae bacterium]
MTPTDRDLSGLEWLSRMSRWLDPGQDPVVTSSAPAAVLLQKGPAPAPSVEPSILPMMSTELQPMKIASKIESSLSEIPWTRTVAAGSLVVGALLLIAGRRKSALAVSAAGAAVALLENPEIVRETWDAMPRVIRSGQDFLVRIEDFVEELNKQGQHIKKVLVQD